MWPARGHRGMIGPSRLRGLSSAERTAACLVSLSYLDGIGPATLRRCHLEHGAEETWFDLLAGRSDRVVPIVDLAARGNPELGARLARQARQRDPIADLAAQRVTGRHLVVHGTRGYPERLVADQAAPAVLFMAGHPDVLRRPTAAIVGTRNATLAGRSLAEDLGEGLARAWGHGGVGSGSGDRRGRAPGSSQSSGGCPTVCDRRPRPPWGGGSHRLRPRCRVSAPSRPSAPGSGRERPASDRDARWNAARHLALSGPQPDHLRLGRCRGGGRVTGHRRFAAYRRRGACTGVPVLAVPGHPSAPASAGTNALIFDGAGLVRDTSDVLLALGLDDPRPQGQPPPTGSGLGRTPRQNGRSWRPSVPPPRAWPRWSPPPVAVSVRCHTPCTA